MVFLAAFSVPDLAKATASLGLLLLVGVAAYAAARRWMTAFRTAEVADDASELMSRFRGLHERGGLSDGEFQHIKGRLGPRLHAEISEAAAAEMIAEGHDAMREAAQYAAARAAEAAGRNASPDQRERAGAAGGAAGDGCEETPPDGGDSTGDRR